MKKRLGPTDRIYPMPSPIVAAGTVSEPNGMAVAWIGIASHTPPSVCMALRRSRYTYELIVRQGEFTVNFPSSSQAMEADLFGIVSGRNAEKFELADWTATPAANVSAPLIAECAYNIECEVTHEIGIGEYALVVGEIVESHAEESILDATGEKVDVAELDPLVYVAGSREYRRIGDKVADAFSVGRQLL
jgi:flavin reductase (DIM6/NTAB) family NADH-FMN oxidoreductase RutF